MFRYILILWLINCSHGLTFTHTGFNRVWDKIESSKKKQIAFRQIGNQIKLINSFSSVQFIHPQSNSICDENFDDKKDMPFNLVSLFYSLQRQNKTKKN